MKQVFLLVLISILFLSFSFEGVKNSAVRAEHRSMLLIKYEEEKSYEILNNGNTKSKNVSGIIPEVGIDDYSPYDSLKRVLYIDGSFNEATSAKVIFWDYSNIDDIYLPFQYKHIWIDSLLNDSTISLRLDSDRVIVKPGQMFVGSYKRISKEDGRTIQYITKVKVKNMGLLPIENIIDNEERLRREEMEFRKNDSLRAEDQR